MEISAQVTGLEDLNQQLQALTNLAGEKKKPKKQLLMRLKFFKMK